MLLCIFLHELTVNPRAVNTLFDFLRRGPGQEYLKATLEAPIQELCGDADLDLEINPMKVIARIRRC